MEFKVVTNATAAVTGAVVPWKGYRNIWHRLFHPPANVGQKLCGTLQNIGVMCPQEYSLINNPDGRLTIYGGNEYFSLKIVCLSRLQHQRGTSEAGREEGGCLTSISRFSSSSSPPRAHQLSHKASSQTHANIETIQFIPFFQRETVVLRSLAIGGNESF